MDPFCLTCGKRVKCNTLNRTKRIKYPSGLQLEYEEVLALCVKCGHTVVLPELDIINAVAKEEAELKSKIV